MVRRLVLIVPAAAALTCAGVVAAALPQGTQTDAAFAASYAARGVVNVSATTQRVSCYAPELTFFPEPRPRPGLSRRRHVALQRRLDDRRGSRPVRNPGCRQPRDARKGPLGVRHSHRPDRTRTI